MVGRLPALKYLFAASSYGCQKASAGCRQDTSACVWTSIATRSLTFISSAPGLAHGEATRVDAAVRQFRAPRAFVIIASASRGARAKTAALHGLADVVLRSASTKLLISVDLIWYITNKGELRFAREATVYADAKTRDARSKITEAKVEDVALTASQASRLSGIFVEQIDLRARMNGRVDPAIGSIVQYARGEALSDVLEIR
jgi:hypothetical protein